MSTRYSRTARQIVDELLARGKRTETGCLISHLKPNKKGYVPVQVGGRDGIKWRANRLIWTVEKGPIPPDLHVCHSCDVRNCIELGHFFLGTGLDNTKDMIAKNRVARLGQPPTNFKLLEEAFRLSCAGFSLNEIARMQGLSGGTSVADRIRRYHDAIRSTFTV